MNESREERAIIIVEGKAPELVGAWSVQEVLTITKQLEMWVGSQIMVTNKEQAEEALNE